MKQVNITSCNDNVTINGVSYRGKNVSVSNGKVVIDGVEQGDETQSKNIVITVKGDVGSVESPDGTIIVHGDVKGNVNATNGDIEAENVGGSVTTTNGDVECWEVAGDVNTTNGDIKYKKR